MALKSTQFQFSDDQAFYRGKVRDVYYVRDLLVSVASDRISAFDHVLPKAIPYKGQVLNQVAQHFLEASRELVPNWLLSCPDPNVSIGLRCEPIKIEMVIRGYMAGHAWREYRRGKRQLCGVAMPDGMNEGDAFPVPIITPATKAGEGHDEDISKEEILEKGIVDREIYERLEHYTYALFSLGQRMANKRGLILVDTKYEFGMHNGEIFLIDEIHTPDSSRYYYLEGYFERQKGSVAQEQLSKEFVREWLMDNGFRGRQGDEMPIMPDPFIEEVSNRYIRLYELITGKKFVRRSYDQIEDQIHSSVSGFLSEY